MCALAFGLALPAAGATRPDLSIRNLSATVGSTSASLSFFLFNGGSTAAGTPDSFGVYFSADAVFDPAVDPLVQHSSVGSVPASGGLQVGTTAPFPAGTQPGVHYLFVVADYLGQVAESDETNNVGSVAVTVPPNVDLQASALSTPATFAAAGDTIVPSLTVSNLGSADSGPSTVSFYLSADTQLDGTDTLLASAALASIAGGGSVTLTPSLALPRVAPAAYTLFAKVDAGGAITEISEANNVASASLKALGIDLVPSIVQPPPAIVDAGASADLSFTIRNVGTVDAPATSWAVYLSDDGSVSAGDTLIGRQQLPNPTQAGGGSAIISTSASIPLGSSPGQKCFLVVADSLAQVAEWDEGDNVASACFNVAAHVDLAASAASAPASVPFTGGPATVSATIANAGNEDAGASRYAVYLSTDTALGSSDTRLAGLPLSPLAAGASTQVSTSVQVPALGPGRYYLLVVADADGEVGDATRGNNVAAAPFAVDAANLVSTVLGGPASALSTGGSLPISFTIPNLGNVAVPVTSWKIWLSRDTTLSQDDVPLAEQPLPSGIAGGGSSAVVSTVVQLPPATDPGRDCLLVQADSQNQVVESNEADNVGSTCFPVVQPETTPPVTTASVDAPATLSGWNRANVTVHLNAADASGIWELHYWVNGGAETVVRGASADVPVTAEGTTTITYHSEDKAANFESPRSVTVQLDKTAPTATCDPGDGAWHAADVTYGCTASDGGSGIAGAASFSLATSVPAGTETASAQTPSRQVCDVAGNCITVGPLTARVDRKAPSFSCPSPDAAWHGGNVAFACTASDGGSGVAPTFSLATSVAAGDETSSAQTGSAQVCDAVGNCVTAAPLGPVKIDRKAPTFSCDQPDTAWHGSNQSFACNGSDGGSGLATPAQLTLQTSVPAGSESAGASTGAGQFCDAAGNCAAVAPLGPVKVDRKAPSVACDQPDGHWHGSDVTYGCAASDGGSGVTGDPSFSLSTSVAAGTDSASAPTSTQLVCDATMNCVTVGPLTAKVDKKAPVVACPGADFAWHGDNQTVSCNVVDTGAGGPPASLDLSTSVPAGVETATAQTGSATVCDAVGNCTPVEPVGPWKIDRAAPSVSCAQPDGAWHGSNQSFVCTGSDGGSGMKGSGTTTLQTSVAAGGETASAQTGSDALCDAVGNCTPVGPLGPVKVDRAAPAYSCDAPDAAWHADNVSFGCTAADGGSGLVGAASFPLSTSVAAGAETNAAQTGTQQVCDATGNCATAGPLGPVKVDRKAPTVAIASPVGSYEVDETVAADYSCADGGSGVAACTGTVADGGPVDTGTVGTKSFAVTATDAAGNTATIVRSYVVEYGVCVPTDVPPGPVGGPLIRVWLVVCDAEGNDVATKATVVTALDLDGGPLPRLPADRKFHREPSGLRYDLDSTGLAAGTHVLYVSISGDPVVHAVRFTAPKPGRGKK